MNYELFSYLCTKKLKTIPYEENNDSRNAAGSIDVDAG